MLGHRGCRLGITYPEIYDMQVRAIFEAACEVAPLFPFCRSLPFLIVAVLFAFAICVTLQMNVPGQEDGQARCPARGHDPIGRKGRRVHHLA